MTDSEILKAARARLTPQTWGKGDGIQQPKNRLCVLMAIGTAGILRETPVNILTCCAMGNEFGRVERWNDAPERTLQDVHDAFDAAIAIAEQQEQNVEPQVLNAAISWKVKPR